MRVAWIVASRQDLDAGPAAGCRGPQRTGRDTAGTAPEGILTMEIQGAGGTRGPQPIYPRLAEFSIDAGQSVQAGLPRDHVEISPLGRMLDGIDSMPEIRQERVDEIRRQIAAGTYETSEKLEVALDRLIDDLSGW
jgi:negative regulator of flagellin synthesis FlgM